MVLRVHECFCDNQVETEQGFFPKGNKVKGQFTIGCPSWLEWDHCGLDLML